MNNHVYMLNKRVRICQFDISSLAIFCSLEQSVSHNLFGNERDGLVCRNPRKKRVCPTATEQKQGKI